MNVPRTWSRLSADEIERRRKQSVEAIRDSDRERFEAWYQEECDRQYWTHGACCAGCDHWSSDGGSYGTCAAAGIVSGADVLKSIGVDFSSYMPPPGFPYTRSDFRCGLFSDSFDWSSLGDDYLTRIGAMRDGSLRLKPPSPQSASGVQMHTPRYGAWEHNDYTALHASIVGPTTDDGALFPSGWTPETDEMAVRDSET